MNAIERNIQGIRDTIHLIMNAVERKDEVALVDHLREAIALCGVANISAKPMRIYTHTTTSLNGDALECKIDLSKVLAIQWNPQNNCVIQIALSSRSGLLEVPSFERAIGKPASECSYHKLCAAWDDFAAWADAQDSMPEPSITLARHMIERLILSTPSGTRRNALTDANLNLMQAEMENEGAQCKTWSHPGTEKTGIRCMLINGHEGPHQFKRV